MRSQWPIAGGLLIGIMLLPVLQVEYEQWHRARHRAQMLMQPVITSQSTIIGRDHRGAVLRITGTKHRDCEFVGVVGIQFDAHRHSDTVSAERIDKPITGATRPVGPFDAGIWRVDVPAGHGAMLEALYDCDGVIVRNLLARVEPDEVQAADVP